LSPKELALAAADPGAGNGNAALPANGQSSGYNQPNAGTGYGNEPGHGETSGNA